MRALSGSELRRVYRWGSEEVIGGGTGHAKLNTCTLDKRAARLLHPAHYVGLLYRLIYILCRWRVRFRRFSPMDQ